MRRLLALSLALSLAATEAGAEVIDIEWGDMEPGCEVGDRFESFLCNSNAASQNRLIVTTFITPISLPAFVGMTVNLRLFTNQVAPLPDWWRMGSGECRSNGWGAVASPANLGLVECADPWGTGSFLGGVTHLSGDGGPSRARIVADLATDIPQQLTADTKYYGEAITLTALRTTGTGSCTGCQAGACLSLESIELYQVAGSPGGDVITLRNYSGFVSALSWQSVVNYPVGCGFISPASHRTWGEIKTLYR